MSAVLTPPEFARRLIRARHFYLFQAGAARRRASEAVAAWVAETALCTQAVADIDAELRAMGFDPGAPLGPVLVGPGGGDAA